MTSKPCFDLMECAYQHSGRCTKEGRCLMPHDDEPTASTTPADLPFLTAPTPPADEALAAAHDLDFEVREIVNGKRKPGKLSLEKLTVVLSYVRAAATREPQAPAVPKGAPLVELARQAGTASTTTGSMGETHVDFTLDGLERFVAAVATQRQPIAPEGWKLVPVEPTEEMMRAMVDPFIAVSGDNRKAFAWAYPRMLAAAPVASEGDSVVPAAQPAEPKERKPLTDDQIAGATGISPHKAPWWIAVVGVARAIERAHGIQEQPKESRE